MRHALGLDRAEKPYRNRYAAAVGTPQHAAWLQIAEAGLADLYRQGFCVTPAGARAIGIDPSLYPEEFSQ
jgi:hypothetical protein